MHICILKYIWNIYIEMFWDIFLSGIICCNFDICLIKISFPFSPPDHALKRNYTDIICKFCSTFDLYFLLADIVFCYFTFTLNFDLYFWQADNELEMGWSHLSVEILRKQKGRRALILTHSNPHNETLKAFNIKLEEKYLKLEGKYIYIEKEKYFKQQAPSKAFDTNILKEKYLFLKV